MRHIGIALVALGLTALFFVSCKQAKSGSEELVSHSSLARVLGTALKDECPNGGVELEYGIDINGSGSLEDEEVNGSYSICHGEPGAAAEACSSVDLGDGQYEIQCAGQDAIVLSDGLPGEKGDKGEPGEPGAKGEAGQDGNDGLDGLIALVVTAEEAAGDNCPAGGVRLNTGLDTDLNGTLDAAEVTDTSYVCNGVAGANGDKGEPGKDGLPGEAGKDGANGDSCTIVQLNDGAQIHCEDGTQATVLHGDKGEPGKDGKDGVKGEPGLNGKDGLKGVDGKDGNDGLANGTTIDGVINITEGINFTDNSTVSGNIVFADQVEFKNSWCPKKPNGERSMVVGGICVAQVFGQRTAQNASLSCANIKADLCTDSQSWVLRSHGLLNANSQGANYANWTNSYSGDDGKQFRHATGNTGDDHGPSDEYVAPCCYNVTPARTSDEKISSVRVIHIHDTADVTFAWASRYCTNLNADLCSKAQYQVLRDKGKISAPMWSNDHSDNDGNVCDSSIGAVVDDPQPRDNHGYACCATSYKAPESVTCPEGVNETKGVCWVKTGQGNWSTAVQDCDTNGAQLCSISQNYVLRNAGIVSGSGNWTQSHSDNDGGNTNWSLGGGSDNPTDGQSYNYACCL